MTEIANNNSYLKGLTDPQAEAVKQIDGPVLILAGAGSGKTKVLTHRVVNIFLTKKIAFDQVLCMTFTNKAAREMEHRIFQLLSEQNKIVHEPMWISTFHSICNRLLRDHSELLGYRKTFTIYDDSDQLSLIKKIVQGMNLNDKIYPPKAFKSRINQAKMQGLTSQSIHKSRGFYMDEKSIEVFENYEATMKLNHAMDFDDLLLKTYQLFIEHKNILELYQEKFKYIMVDEYQDTNHVQYKLIKVLASKYRNICVVGDEDQSIYSWRGADINNILDFEKDFGETKVIKLEQNFRSTKNIVAAASAVIKKNTQRKDKTLFTEKPDGELISAREENNEYDEAKFVVKKIAESLSSGSTQLTDIAVFYRTNAQSRVLEEQLRQNSIPYKLVGGIRFYDRAEVKDLVAYLKVIVNPSDDIAFKRIINTPARGIGKTTIDTLEEKSLKERITMWEAAARAVEQRLFHAGTTSKLRNFLELMSELTSLQGTLTPLDLYHTIVDKTEYVQRLKAEDTIEAQSRIENLEELSNALSQFIKDQPTATVSDFLEKMSLDTSGNDKNEHQPAVTLMTLHVSKGLEFPLVFIVGMEENLFPSRKSSDEDEELSLEEERRLAYVGFTRAREKLYLTYAKSRKVWGQDQQNPPSRFLSEIPSNFIQFSAGSVLPSFLDRFQKQYGHLGKKNYDEYKQESYDDDTEPTFMSQPISTKPKGEYQSGMRVKHPTFGVGSIYQVEGSGDLTKISVVFSDQVLRKFVAKFARLEKV